MLSAPGLEFVGIAKRRVEVIAGDLRVPIRQVELATGLFIHPSVVAEMVVALELLNRRFGSWAEKPVCARAGEAEQQLEKCDAGVVRWILLSLEYECHVGSRVGF